MASTRQNEKPIPSDDNGARVAQLERLARHLIRTGDEEKRRLARELHNELGSNLTAVNLDVA